MLTERTGGTATASVSRAIIAQQALSAYAGREISPGVQVQSELTPSCASMRKPLFIPCSNAMGYDEMAVVDNQDGCTA